MHKSLQIRCRVFITPDRLVIDQSDSIMLPFRIRHSRNIKISNLFFPVYQASSLIRQNSFSVHFYTLHAHSIALLIKSFISGVNNNLLLTSPTL